MGRRDRAERIEKVEERRQRALEVKLRGFCRQLCLPNLGRVTPETLDGFAVASLASCRVSPTRISIRQKGVEGRANFIAIEGLNDSDMAGPF